MKTIVAMLLFCFALGAAAANPTPQECKQDPLKEGCQKK